MKPLDLAFTLTDRLARRVIAELKRWEGGFLGTDGNAWCEYVNQKIDGEWMEWPLYETFIDLYIITQLKKPAYVKHVLTIWSWSREGIKYEGDDDNYEHNLFGVDRTRMISPSEEWMYDGICNEVKGRIIWYLPCYEEAFDDAVKHRKRRSTQRRALTIHNTVFGSDLTGVPEH